MIGLVENDKSVWASICNNHGGAKGKLDCCQGLINQQQGFVYCHWRCSVEKCTEHVTNYMVHLLRISLACGFSLILDILKAQGFDPVLGMIFAELTSIIMDAMCLPGVPGEKHATWIFCDSHYFHEISDKINASEGLKFIGSTTNLQCPWTNEIKATSLF